MFLTAEGDIWRYMSSQTEREHDLFLYIPIKVHNIHKITCNNFSHHWISPACKTNWHGHIFNGYLYTCWFRYTAYPAPVIVKPCKLWATREHTISRPLWRRCTLFNSSRVAYVPLFCMVKRSTILTQTTCLAWIADGLITCLTILLNKSVTNSDLSQSNPKGDSRSSWHE